MFLSSVGISRFWIFTFVSILYSITCHGIQHLNRLSTFHSRAGCLIFQKSALADESFNACEYSVVPRLMEMRSIELSGILLRFRASPVYVFMSGSWYSSSRGVYGKSSLLRVTITASGFMSTPMALRWRSLHSTRVVPLPAIWSVIVSFLSV